MSVIIRNKCEAVGFCAERFEDRTGYTWTLTSFLGELLEQAQGAFGARQLEWTILGIEFSGAIPQVWYPKNKRYVSIMLTDNAKSDPDRAIFQLAHEVVHTLAPNGGGATNVLEEGLATIFQHHVCNRYFIKYRNLVPAYMMAEAAAAKLIQAHPDAIKTLRTKEPYIHKFTDKLLIDTYPDLDPALATELCGEFNQIAEPPK